MNDKEQEYLDKMNQLRKTFIEQIPAKLDEVKRLCKDILDDNYDQKTIKRIHFIVHGLTGTCGTFGFQTLMNRATTFDNWLRQFTQGNAQFNKEQLAEIESMTKKLCATSLVPDVDDVFSQGC